MEFITDYYILIICLGLFIMFSLIGYLIETIKHNKEEKNSIENEINQVKVEETEETTLKPQEELDLPKENIILNQGDELLNNYDKNISKDL